MSCCPNQCHHHSQKRRLRQGKTSNEINVALIGLFNFSSVKVKPTSIFDENESSDEDLFKPKPRAVGSLFSPIPPTPAASAAFKPVEKIQSSSGSVVANADVSVKPPPSQSQSLKPQPEKTLTKKSIFDESDSDDELFGSSSINKSINSNRKQSFKYTRAGNCF